MPDPTSKPQPILARLVPPDDVAKTVWRLKVQGMDVDDICAVTKLSPQEVADTIEMKAQERRISVASSFDTEAVLSLERLDAMMKAIWDKAIDGDLSAIKTLSALDESRRKMLGLDAAKIQGSLSPEAGAQVDLRVFSSDELREYRRLTEKLSSAVPKKLPPAGGGTGEG